VKATLSKRDIEICETIGPELARLGMIFVGIDVIGDYLTEINVTSPTGIRQVTQFGGPDIAAMIWDVVERKVKAERRKGRAL
jgi:glutathione synthase